MSTTTQARLSLTEFSQKMTSELGVTPTRTSAESELYIYLEIEFSGALTLPATV